MRSLPKKTNRTPTETQQLQRQLFTTVAEFLSPMSNVLSRYFGHSGGYVSRRNQAMSYHMTEAVEYVDPNFDILYNKVLISKGDLVGVQNPTAASTTAEKISYTWEDNSGQGSAKATDQLVVVIYAPAENLYYTLLNAAVRNAGSVTITLSSYFSGLEVQSWITFASETGKAYATSVYMGAVTIV
ncbi:DUF6266 family protein [Flavobacterium sp. WG47]|nr:DUF6266 family protein [Flavobacterium sp. WG47]